MIYLVRHGQTEFNAERRVQGALDSPLTPLGIDQGRRLGRLFSGLVPPDCRIISSPLGRARHTARLIHENSGIRPDITLDTRLREISLGQWDGLLRADIEQQTPDFDADKRRWTWFFHAPGGETLTEVEARLRDWLDVVLGLEGPSIVVSHGVSGRILRKLFLNLPLEQALMQDIPQDACFRLHEGRSERIDCPPQ